MFLVQGSICIKGPITIFLSVSALGKIIFRNVRHVVYVNLTGRVPSGLGPIMQKVTRLQSEMSRFTLANHLVLIELLTAYFTRDRYIAQFISIVSC